MKHAPSNIKQIILANANVQLHTHRYIKQRRPETYGREEIVLACFIRSYFLNLIVKNPMFIVRIKVAYFNETRGNEIIELTLRYSCHIISK